METFPLIVALAPSRLCAAIAVPVADTQAEDSWSNRLGKRVQLRSVKAFLQLLLNCFF